MLWLFICAYTENCSLLRHCRLILSVTSSFIISIHNIRGILPLERFPIVYPSSGSRYLEKGVAAEIPQASKICYDPSVHVNVLHIYICPTTGISPPSCLLSPKILIAWHWLGSISRLISLVSSSKVSHLFPLNCASLSPPHVG